MKRQELTWEQFLTEVTVINDEEARWDSSKQKEDDEDKKRPSSSNKRAKASKKKTKNGLSECAEEFCKELDISKEEYLRGVCDRLCLKCGWRVTLLVIVRAIPLLPWEKTGRISLLELGSANSDNQVLTIPH